MYVCTCTPVFKIFVSIYDICKQMNIYPIIDIHSTPIQQVLARGQNTTKTLP